MENELIYYIPRWFFYDNIGDSILTTALILPIKKKFPNRALTVVCDEFLSEIYKTNPHVYNVRPPYFEERSHINDLNFWMIAMERPKSFFSIAPHWHPDLFSFLRHSNNLQNMIDTPDKNIIICNYLLQNDFHPLSTKDTMPRIYLTEDDKKTAREHLAKYTSKYKVCIVVSERRRSDLRDDCSPLRYTEASWRQLVGKLKTLLGDVTVFEVGNPTNYHIGDYYIPHVQNIRELAAVLNEMDIGVMSDGGIHHIFNAIDKKYVLFQAYECNAPDLFLMQANGSFDPTLHQECRFQCHLFSKILNIDDESKKCAYACYGLDPYKLAEFTVETLFEKEKNEN